MFDAFRDDGAPTYYAAQHTPWQADLVVSGLIFAFGILALSFYMIIPGIAGKEKWYSLTRITVSLFIGAVILVTNFTMTWDTAKTDTRTKFKAGSGQEVNVTIGVYIGFRGVNITLKGEKDQIPGETIDYNEHFGWESLQGRLGFGPFAGQFNQQYRAAQVRGLPLPILWAAEYFTFDGEGLRWGRYYRQAGWYAHVMLWLAFPLWILANFLFFVLLRYGAYMLVLTGLSMMASNIIWAFYRNFTELEIRFTSHDVLEFSFGASFWICLITGILCIVLGLTVFLLDKLHPGPIAVFFGVDVIQDSESVLVEEDTSGDASNQTPAEESRPPNELQVPGNEQEQEDEIYSRDRSPSPSVSNRAKSYSVNMDKGKKLSYRTKEHRLTKRLQRPRRRDPPPSTYASKDDEDHSYHNILVLEDKTAPFPGQSRDAVQRRISKSDDTAFNFEDGDIELTKFQHA